MMRETVLPLVVIAAVAAGGWYYREPLKQQFDKSKTTLPFSASDREQAPQPLPEAAPAPRKDTVYRWVDDKGVVHYDQQASAGSEATVIDQGRIQSLNQYGQPAGGHGTAVAQTKENAGSAGSSENGQPRKSLRAMDRFPQTQIVNP